MTDIEDITKGVFRAQKRAQWRGGLMWFTICFGWILAIMIAPSISGYVYVGMIALSVWYYVKG